MCNKAEDVLKVVEIPLGQETECIVLATQNKNTSCPKMKALSTTDKIKIVSI